MAETEGVAGLVDVAERDGVAECDGVADLVGSGECDGLGDGGALVVVGVGVGVLGVTG